MGLMACTVWYLDDALNMDDKVMYNINEANDYFRSFQPIESFCQLFGNADYCQCETFLNCFSAQNNVVQLGYWAKYRLFGKHVTSIVWANFQLCVQIDDEVRLEDDWVPLDEQLDPVQLEEVLREKDAHSSAVVLESVRILCIYNDSVIFV